MRIVMAGLFIAAIYPAVAAPQRDEMKSEVTAWYVANSMCRGSYPGKKQEVSCAFRDEVLGPEMEKAGMCYGKKSEPNNDLTWHKCGSNSRR